MKISALFSGRRGWFLAGLIGVTSVGVVASKADAQAIKRFTGVLVQNTTQSPVQARDVDKSWDANNRERIAAVITLEANDIEAGAAPFQAVPDDKVFVIEFVSARSAIPGDHAPLSIGFVSAQDYSQDEFTMHWLMTHREQGVDGKDVVVASQQVKVYAGPGTPLGCIAMRTSKPEAGSYPIYVDCVIEGHYEDI